MDRKMIKTGIVVWSVVGVLAIALLVTLLAGGRQMFNRLENEENRSLEIVKEVTLTDLVSDFSLEWKLGNATVLKSADDTILVRQKASWNVPEEKQVSAIVTGQKLIVEDRNGQSGFAFSFFGLTWPKKTYLEIHLPEKLYDSMSFINHSGKTIADGVQAGKLSVENRSGETRITGIFSDVEAHNSSGELDFETTSSAVIKTLNSSGESNIKGSFTRIDAENTSGRLKIDNLLAGTVSAINRSGDIVLTGLYTDARLENSSGSINMRDGSGSLEARCLSGGIKAEGAFSRLNVHVTSGNLAVRSTLAPESIDGNVASGSLRISIPDNDGFTQSVQKSSGSFSTDFSMANDSVYKDGSAQYRFHITSGGVRLERTTA